MKKINMNRLAAGLLVLVLLTSCFVGSTMARYATGAEGSDTARAAKFGITIEAYGKVFGQDYIKNVDPNGDEALISGTANLTVSSKADAEGKRDNVVAPGTKGDEVLSFNISGSTEVAVKVTVTLDNQDKLGMITLPGAEGKQYTDYTKYIMGNTADDSGYNLKFDQATNYNPIKWTLSKNDNPIADCTKVTLDVIEKYLEDNICGEYLPNSAEFAGICGEYTLSWIWEYGVDSPADTYIGKVAADDVTDTSVKLNESFGFKIYIEQVD